MLSLYLQLTTKIDIVSITAEQNEGVNTSAILPSVRTVGQRNAKLEAFEKPNNKEAFKSAFIPCLWDL